MDGRLNLIRSSLEEFELKSWEQSAKYVRNLPYGRTNDRADYASVLIEQKGTCSTKHALLKYIADNVLHEEVKLILCIYAMNEANTPGVGKVLDYYGLEYIPEAHCYIKHHRQYKDLTSNTSDYSRIETNILDKREIQPDDIGDYKINYHQKYLQDWASDQKLHCSFEELWKIREECIKSLSMKTA